MLCFHPLVSLPGLEEKDSKAALSMYLREKIQQSNNHRGIQAPFYLSLSQFCSSFGTISVFLAQLLVVDWWLFLKAGDGGSVLKAHPACNLLSFVSSSVFDFSSELFPYNKSFAWILITGTSVDQPPSVYPPREEKRRETFKNGRLLRFLFYHHHLVIHAYWLCWKLFLQAIAAFPYLPWLLWWQKVCLFPDRTSPTRKATGIYSMHNVSYLPVHYHQYLSWGPSGDGTWPSWWYLEKLGSVPTSEKHEAAPLPARQQIL